MNSHRLFLLLAFAALPLTLGACASKAQRTAKAVNCGVISLDILPNDATRRGSTTDWCARCKGELYRCISNAARGKVECRPAREEDRCG